MGIPPCIIPAKAGIHRAASLCNCSTVLAIMPFSSRLPGGEMGPRLRRDDEGAWVPWRATFANQSGYRPLRRGDENHTDLLHAGPAAFLLFQHLGDRGGLGGVADAVPDVVSRVAAGIVAADRIGAVVEQQADHLRRAQLSRIR